MKRCLILAVVAFLLAGCVSVRPDNFPPITGHINKETISFLEGNPKSPVKVAILLDRETRGMVITKEPDGSTGKSGCEKPGGQIVPGGRPQWEYVPCKYPIKFGESFSNILVEICQLIFSDVRLLDELPPPGDYVLVNIKADNVDIGFEFSASEVRKPALDKARISATLKTAIIGEDGKEITNFRYNVWERQEERLGLDNQMAAYENCLNKGVSKYVDKITRILLLRK